MRLVRTHNIEYSRRQVGHAHGLPNALSRMTSAGQQNHQGNMDLRLVEAIPMAEQSVLAELLAMVGSDYCLGSA